MRRFTQLYAELDRTTRTNEKLAAMRRYFQEAPPEDAAWGLFFLSGQKIKRTISSAQLRVAIANETHLPLWLIDESYAHVGDVAETLAWLLPESDASCSMNLAAFVEAKVLALRFMDDRQRRQLLHSTWQELSSFERLVWHKLITGEFRVGVSQTLVTRALAEVAGVAPAVMAQRLSGVWQPTAEFFERIVLGVGASAPVSQPYPFFLAYALDVDPSSLGSLEDWQIEWKWDGIRAQVLRRGGAVEIWTRGEELVTDRFPEVAAGAESLPDGTVLDGEILAWRSDRPLPFAVLQRRIGRLRPSGRILKQAPVAFLSFDLLEHESTDIREQPLSDRRRKLEALLETAKPKSILLSPLVGASSWAELEALRTAARDRGAEGLMLKRRDSAYGVGRVRGPWWKWKSQPLSVDAVLIAAQPGHGRRAGLFTDYTFGVWHEGELVPVAKAYSGLSDAEIREVDAFVRANTLGKFGPVRTVRPQLVFELHFEGIQRSTRHRSGVAVRFPRIHRQRFDKKPSDADTLAMLKALIAEPLPSPSQERLLFDIH